MVGSSSDAEFEKAKIVLNGMGKKFYNCGGPGMGEVAKLSNNLTLGINMIASCEGLILGQKLGIDPKVLTEILSVSTANNWCIDCQNPVPGVLPGAPSTNEYKGGFMGQLIRKDLALALECADSVDAKLRFATKAVEYYS